MRSDLSLRHGCALMLLVVFFGAYGCGSGGGDNDMVSPRLTPTSAPSPSPPVASPTIGGIQAIAVGALSVPVGENQGVILRSRDSGSSWTVVQTVANSLNALSFPDHNNGWAVGPSSIVHSADSGDSWSVQREIPEDLRDVEFTSSSHGVAVGGLPLQPGNFSGGGLVLVTDDSGTTWSPVTLPQSVPLQRATLMSVCFTTTATGVTFGEGVSGGVALRSDDGGAAWQDISDRLDGDGLKGAACIGASEIWVVGVGPRAIHSMDGGLTWEDRSAPLTAVFTGELFAVEFETPLVGWAAGDRSVGETQTIAKPIVVHTLDGGTTWQEQALPESAAAGSISGSAFRSSNGLLVGQANREADATLPIGFVTIDGGTTWSPASFPPSTGLLQDVT